MEQASAVGSSWLHVEVVDSTFADIMLASASWMGEESPWLWHHRLAMEYSFAALANRIVGGRMDW